MRRRKSKTAVVLGAFVASVACGSCGGGSGGLTSDAATAADGPQPPEIGTAVDAAVPSDVRGTVEANSYDDAAWAAERGAGLDLAPNEAAIQVQDADHSRDLIDGLDSVPIIDSSVSDLVVAHDVSSPVDQALPAGDAAMDSDVADAGSADGCPPGLRQCADNVPQTCNAVGVWVNGVACPYLCAAGLCAGVCTPGSTRCLGNTPQACDATGAWQSSIACSNVCSGGACTGNCIPGSMQCRGLIPQTCDGSGSWVDGTACPYVCASGSCIGSCTPASKRCSGTAPQTCDDAGQWQGATACPYLCNDGTCVGSCVPGSKRCTGNTPQTCSTAASWVDGSDCPYVCTSGSCTGSCVPQAMSACGTGGTQRCNASGELDVCEGSGYTITSTCSSSSVQMSSDGAALGGAACVFLVNYPMCDGTFCHSDYTLDLDAKLDSGGGYGVWFRGSWNSGAVHALGVQYDTGAGGIKFLHYPETESAFKFTSYALDSAWHHWQLVGAGSRVQVYLDGALLLDSSSEPASGASFGFRTWWSNTMEFRNLVVSPSE